MRLNDFCHPNNVTVPVPRAFPATCRGFRRVGAMGSLGSSRLDRRDGRFHDVRTALADRHRAHFFTLTVRSRDVGVLFPRRRCDRASDIPVASPRASLHRTFVRCLEER